MGEEETIKAQGGRGGQAPSQILSDQSEAGGQET